MGTRRGPRYAMTWQSTLRAMIEGRVRTLRSCSACGCWGEVDLAHMVAVLGGDDMTLWDCRPPCPLCGKPMLHLASPGPGSPALPLVSQPGDHDLHPLPAQAWMAAWTGRFL